MSELTVYKYPLLVSRRPSIMVPAGAKLLKVAAQDPAATSQLSAWVLVDPKAPMTKTLEFYVTGTGLATPDDLLARYNFVDTVLCNHGELVWHVWLKRT